jgi:hypothetical protein
MQNVVVISIIVIIIILVITFMQGIYNYIPQTSHVSRLCSFAAVLYLQSVLYTVAAVLYLQSVLYVTLFPMFSFRAFTLVLPSLSLQRPIWLFFVFRAFPVCCSGIVWVILKYYYYYYYYFLFVRIYVRRKIFEEITRMQFGIWNAIHTHTYIYIHMCVCVRIYIYMWVYMYICNVPTYKHTGTSIHVQ